VTIHLWLRWHASAYAGKSEYEALLAFVEDESKKQELEVDDGQEDEETKQGKRLWYAPWKHEAAEQTMKKVRGSLSVCPSSLVLGSSRMA
jgi:hypothetical protein